MSLSAGSWIIFGNLFFPTTTFRELSISSTSGTTDINAINGVTGTVGGYTSISRCVTVASGVQTYHLVANSTPAVTTVNPIFYAVRVG